MTFLFLIALPDTRLTTSFYTFQKFGSYSISDLYLNYAFSRYDFGIVLEKRISEIGLRSFWWTIDSVFKDYRLTLGEKQLNIQGPISTTLPLWGITFTRRDGGIFLGRTKDQTSALPPTFHQNNYTFGFNIKKNISYRIPVDFYFLKKNDATGAVRDNNSLGANAHFKFSENLLINSQYGINLSSLGIGNAGGMNIRYNGQKYGANAHFRKIFKNFITPVNTVAEPGNWFQLNTYVQPLDWLAIAQDISYSDLYNINLGTNFSIHKPPLPELGYGISFSKKNKLITQNLHSGWRYKKFSISSDYAWSSANKSLGFMFTQRFNTIQFWSQLQFRDAKILQFGLLFPFSANLTTRGFLNIVSRNNYMNLNKGFEFSLKFFKNLNLRTTYENVKYNNTTEHNFSFNISNTLFFEQTGLGFISGKVFMDLNGNNIFDVEDQVVPGVEVILDGRESITSDDKGNFQFSFVPIGEHTLMLKLGCMPAEIGTDKRTAIVRTGFFSRIKVDFPLGQLGLIEGIVYYDDNKNGKKDKEESGAPNCVIALNGFVTTTDKNGKFRFANLTSGTYALQPKILPPETFLSIPELTFIHIKPGEEFKDYEIGLVRKERPVKNKIFEEPQIIKPEKPRIPKPKKSLISSEEIEKIFKKGVEHFIAQEFDTALKLFDQVLILDPQHKRAREYKKRTIARIEVLQKE